ncbi:hypothetical protein JT359_16510 [Candidatus Poribacteria bacterium]|nr:hypothetical protein [Candidatus Poribacteria bacterium]
MKAPKINNPTLIKEQHKITSLNQNKKLPECTHNTHFINPDTVPRTLMSTNRTTN